MKKVSVIVPVYGTESYLAKCLDSLVNQTLEDIEILVINDGSPDNSQIIIDKYVNEYPDKIKSYIKENGGQGTARNLGLDYANGEYISFVDSDDYLDINMLKEMYDVGKKNNSDVIICDLVDHYTNQEIYHNCTKYNSVFEVTPSACNKIFKKEIIANIKFLPKIWYEDFNFTTKILLNTDKISTISKGFYNCHCGHVSTMNNNNSLKNLDIITAVNDIIDYSKEINKYDENLMSFLIFHHILVTSVNRVSLQKNKDKKYVIKKLIQYCRANIPHYSKYPFYKNIILKKKIIGWLNYNYLYNISKLLLNFKKLLNRRK